MASTIETVDLKPAIKPKGSFKSALVLAICLLLWILFFVAGSAVPSDDLLQRAVAEGARPRTRILNMLGFVFTWTWSNIIWLCCFSTLVGEYGREALGRKGMPNMVAALVRGFFIFLAMATGQLVIAGTLSMPPSLLEEAVNPNNPVVVSPGQYFRIATFCSFVGFFVGFSPRIFTSLLNRVERMAGEEASVKEPV